MRKKKEWRRRRRRASSFQGGKNVRKQRRAEVFIMCLSVCVCVRFKLPGYRVRRLQLKESTDVKVRLTE